MKRVATIILNRNLPTVTEALYDHLEKYDNQDTDLFVVESGSDDDKLSKKATWHADWETARKHGLRYSRGMNFGLSELWKEGKFQHYEAFFLLTNDTELEPRETISPLLRLLDQHPRLGIISPCSRRWGERFLLNEQKTKYFWFIHNNAFMMRREFIETICNADQPSAMNFLFDGENFRGYGTEHEIIAKAYANDWAAAITTEVWAGENESYLLNKADLIKTEGYEENLRLYIEEGRDWMRKKYGFNSHWSMQQYVKSFYDKFFFYHPECSPFRV
jgi:GT2 family glycosyltransferase